MVDGGLPTIKTGACRKWRLQARLPLLPLKAFDHRGLFAADISACATMNEYIEVIARARRVLADQLGFVSLRSEEHTSELQSLMRITYAVFCLKKKKTHEVVRHRALTVERRTQ